MSNYVFSTDSRNFDKEKNAAVYSEVDNRVRRSSKVRSFKKYVSCFAFGIVFGLAYFTQFRMGTAAQALLDVVRYAVIVGGIWMFSNWHQTKSPAERRKLVQPEFVEKAFRRTRNIYEVDYPVIRAKGRHISGKM